MRVADYIMEKLYSEGISHLFMITGRGVLYLSDAAAKLADLHTVSMHHEQACAYAAYTYAAYNGGIGACLITTGCGSTNAITGTLCAWQDGIPCVFISGQNTLRETTRFTKLPLRTWGQQEMDIVSVVEPITKYAVMLDKAEDVAYELEKALYLATHGHKGPVWIDVPLDIQNARVEPNELRHFIPPEDEALSRQEDIQSVVEMLNMAKRPILLIGSGIRSAGAVRELVAFVEKNSIPVAYSASAPDVVAYSEPLSVGSVGMMACSRSGCFAVQNADLLLVVGNRLSPMTTGPSYQKFARQAKTVVVDIDEKEHKKDTVRIDKLILCDAKAFLEKMNQCNIEGDYREWTEKCRHWKEVFPLCEDTYRQTEKVDLYELAERLSETLPEECVFLCDAGLEELILPSNVDFSKGRRCIHPHSQGAMGFALPAAVGAYYASGRPTVAVIGDGSVMMNLQEFATISYYKLPVKVIIIENNTYSVIRKRQIDLFRTRTVGTDAENGVPSADFRKVAECFDISYMEIKENRNLNDALKSLFASIGPIICQISGLENQDYIACSVARTSERRFVQRPLEDQAPFLDRNIFMDEMIVEPIDQ